MIRGKKRALACITQLHKEMKFAIHNRFDVEVIDAATGEVKQKAYAENIVLDALWAKLLTPATYFNYIHYGTGTGTLSPSRTSLFSFLGAKAVAGDVINSDYNAGWYSFQKNIQISEVEHVGSTLSEVGIGHGSSAANLVTHAMLKDMNGNPISIVKTNTDIINIYATVFIHWNASGYGNGTINFAEIYPQFIDTYAKYNIKLFLFLSGQESALPNRLNFTIGDPIRQSSYLSQSLAQIKTPTYTYSIANKKITLNTIRLAAGEGNSGLGLRGVGLSMDNARLTYGIPFLCFDIGKLFPTTILGESIGTGDGNTRNFSTAFPFAKEGAKIFVDGIEQTSGVTVLVDKPKAKNISHYMEVISYKIPNTTPGAFKHIPLPGEIVDAQNSSVAGECILFNPYHLDGIDSYKASSSYVYASDDMVNWSLVSTYPGNDVAGYTITVLAEHKNKPYWKLVGRDASQYTTFYNSMFDIFCNAYDNYKNIRFDTAPASGAVITADYDCEVIAKDANHVFDFSFEITLAEKTT